jgi:hypothetical protein
MYSKIIVETLILVCIYTIAQKEISFLFNT